MLSADSLALRTKRHGEFYVQVSMGRHKDCLDKKLGGRRKVIPRATALRLTVGSTFPTVHLSCPSGVLGAPMRPGLGTEPRITASHSKPAPLQVPPRLSAEGLAKPGCVCPRSRACKPAPF
jgi:hypothetical protein